MVDLILSSTLRMRKRKRNILSLFFLLRRMVVVSSSSLLEKEATSQSELRHYEPAWLVLKASKEVNLKVAPHMVARVRKAIIKEKDKDRVFKFSQREAGKPRLLLRSSYSSK